MLKFIFSFALLLSSLCSIGQVPKNGTAGGKNNSVILERYNVASKTSNVKSGPSEKWYHGVKIISCEYLDGRKNGLWKSQSVDGKIFYQGNYSDDVKNGAWKYYLNQKRLCITYFKDGKKDSTWQSFYPNGNIQCIKTYSNDIQAGPFKLYYENGVLKNEAKYTDDYIDGNDISYYPNGSVMSTIKYKHGAPYDVIKMNDSLGNNLNFGTLKNGTGTLIEYSISGKKRCLTTYQDSYKNGVSLRFFENGKTFSEDFYSMGKRDGTSSIFTSTGEIYRSFIYMEGSVIKSNYSEKIDYTLIKKDFDEVASLNNTENEIMPEFLGGEEGLVSYIANCIEYPLTARSHNQQGTVYTNLVVSTDGTLNDIHILKGVTEELDSEAIRVINKMPPWIPGFQNGLPVAVQYNLPIKFILIK